MYFFFKGKKYQCLSKKVETEVLTANYFITNIYSLYLQQMTSQHHVMERVFRYTQMIQSQWGKCSMF